MICQTFGAIKCLSLLLCYYTLRGEKHKGKENGKLKEKKNE